MKALRHAILAAALAAAATAAQPAAVFSSWSGVNPGSGNYVLTVVDTGSHFDWTLGVSPWNAEALGLFVDFGAVTITGAVPVSGVSGGPVVHAASDTATSSCGSGCNLGGLALPALGGGDWELVFRLGNAGFDGVSTFHWVTPNFGLGEDDIRLVAVRAQQFCPDGLVLPSAACSGSDKAFAWPSPPASSPASSPPGGVPVAPTLLLAAAALAAAGAARPRRR